MNLRLHLLSSSLVLLLVTAVASAQDDGAKPFDCRITYGDLKYDLTSLTGEHTVTRTRDTPPTTMIDSITFNLCEDLKPQDGVKEEEQCPSGSRACLTKINRKQDDEDRIVAVIPLANSTTNDVEYSPISSPKGLSLTFMGAPFPSSSNPDEPIPQSFHLRLLCSLETSEPAFVSYNGKQAEVEWNATAGCNFGSPSGGDAPKEDEDTGGGDDGGKSDESVGSGVGYFFLLLLLAFVAYFALGAYYNYSTYGATGTDLIPHRDFWREVPYMLRDVVSHLCSTVRPRQGGNRGGYIAV